MEILLAALIWPRVTRSLRWLLDTVLGAVLLSFTVSMAYADQAVRLVITLALPVVIRVALAELDTARRDALATGGAASWASVSWRSRRRRRRLWSSCEPRGGRRAGGAGPRTASDRSRPVCPTPPAG